MMTSYTWMFRSSYEKLRARILNKNTIITLIRPEYHFSNQPIFLMLLTR